MEPDFIKRLLTAILLLCSLATFGQMPVSPCGPSGGKRADLLGIDVRYSAPGTSAPVFQVPAGTKSISVYISSETGITSGGRDYAQGDEDFITISAVIDIASNTSSGYVNYAKNTFMNGSGTNVYGWQNAPLGAFIPALSKQGDASPDLNNVNFSITGNTLTITQSATGIHSSYYVQYLSPFNNSLYLLQPEAKALLHGQAAANTDLLLPIPADADIIFISGKGTNSSYADLNTSDGTEEGYANLRFTIDLNKGTTNGFITLANGGSANRRSTYVVNNLGSTYSGQLVGSGAVDGDYNGKSTNVGAVGLFNPSIYVSGSNLVIRRDADYARDFDDAYAVEFYKRAGQGMSAEFVNSEIRSIPKGQSATSGVTRTFTIPPGTNAIYFNETGNACNVDRESNENSLEAYAYIDLTTETATGYFYQQVGLSLTERRDDNFAFKGVPLNNSSVRNHPNTVGFKGRYNYDISFALSADKSQLTVTNKTGLANPDYQVLLSADYYGSKPDIAFNASAITFSKVNATKVVKADLAICNPGSGNSNGGMPVAFYHGDPTVDPSAKLLYTGTFGDEIRAGECRDFSFDIDLSNFNDLNIDLTIVINDDGSFVAGGIGHTVGTPFSLTSLARQHATYQECYYENNLLTKRIAVNNSPEVDPDPDNSSGATGAFTYRNTFTAGSAIGATIADADLTIVDPDAATLSAATITLTNVLDAGSEGLYLEGTLPAGITITGNGTNVVSLSGQAPQSDYIAALKMLAYKNAEGSPQTADRIITVVLNDGIEPGPASTTTIFILTDPRIAVTGNGISIADNSTAVSTADGTDFGRPVAALTRTFSIRNAGTGILNLTGSPAVAIAGGDGFTIDAQPAGASLASAASTDFTVRFDPAGHAPGKYTAVIHIANNDADADHADYTFTVTAVINALPVGTGDTRITLEDVPVDGAVIASDADNDQLSFAKDVGPANGTVEVRSDGSYTYTPDAGYNGSDHFTIAISDGHGGDITAAVIIIVIPVNDIPTGTGDTRITQEDVPVDGVVTGDDADDDPLTFTKASEPANGTVDVRSDGSYTYTPNPDYNGSDNFTITISDDPGGSVTVTVSITVTPVNDAPTGTGDSKTTPEDIPVDGAVKGKDADNDPLTFTKATDPVNGTADIRSDGTYTYTPNPDYNGSDHFTMTISDGQGGSTTVTVSITVTPVNDAPTGTDDNKTTPEDTPVDGAVKGKDVDNDPLTFTKATDPVNGTADVRSDGNYTYTPNPDYNGSDNFTIAISDGNGGSATVTVSITVTPVNDAPAGTGDNKTTPEDTPVDGAVKGKDIDNDPLTFIKATDPTNGTADVRSDGTYTYTPNPDYNGSDHFTITISDGQGGSTTVTVSITVTPVNDAPTGTGDNKTTPEDTPVDGAVKGKDIDNDPLTFTKATDPTNGTVDVRSDGTYTYTPNANYNGSDNFTITISDGNGGSATVTVSITVTPVNDAPTGTGDTKTTPEDTPVDGAVKGKDVDNDPLTFIKATDPTNGTADVRSDGTYTYTPNPDYNGSDHFTITVSDGQGSSTTVTVSITVTPVNDAPTGTGDTKTTPEDTPVDGAVKGKDADNDPLTFTKATDPTNGTADVRSDGTYTYTPNPDYNGSDHFTMTISDGQGGSTTVTVSITVTPVNDAPTGTDDNKTTPEDTPVDGAVKGKDVDNDPLTFTKATDPTNGTADVRSDGNYTYTPNLDYNGSDHFTITISDGQGRSTTITVSITVTPVNDAPTGEGDAKTTPEDTPIDGIVTGKDIDHDPLTFTKATDPTNGTVDVRSDGTYTYTPNANYNGSDNFTITISDGNGGSTTVTVTFIVTPVNDAPTGEGDAQTTPEDTPVRSVVTGQDIDHDPLTFTKATDPTNGTADVKPDGTYTYTPNANYNGSDNFTITISDGNGGSTTVSVTINVTPVNDLPSGRGDSRTTPEDTPVSGVVTGKSVDGSALTFTSASDPAHGTVTVYPDGTYTYTPDPDYNGPDNFSILIKGSKGNGTTVAVNITVTPVNDIPTGAGDTRTTPENTPVQGAVNGTDADGDVLTFSKSTDPMHGAATVNADGSYIYTPHADYSGPDNFTITISDGNGGSISVPVAITVIPAAENAGISLVKKAVLRADNISITYLLIITNTGNAALHNVTVTDAMLGLTKVLPADLLPGASTTITAVYRITQEDRDNGRVTNTAVVKGLTPSNLEVTDISGTSTDNDSPTAVKVSKPPHASNDQADTRTATPVTIPVLANDDAGQSAFNTGSISIITQPVHGRLILHLDGTITYTPENGYTGEDDFMYRVQDLDGYATNVAIVKLIITAGDVKIPTLFTPNGDGKNDVFEIRGLQMFEENELVIVNRWGNEVYRQKNYQNTWKGDGLNEGTYYYLLRLKKHNGSGWEVLKGYTTLIRKFKQ